MQSMETAQKGLNACAETVKHSKNPGGKR